jgi:hypothetical protein
MFEFLYIFGTLVLALNGVRPFGLPLALSDLLYLGALICLFADCIYHKYPLSSLGFVRSFWIPSFLVLIGGLIASSQAVQTSVSIIGTIKTWFVFSIFISMGIVIVRRGKLGATLIALVVGIFSSALIAIIDSLSGAQIGPKIYYITGVSSGINPIASIISAGRYSGTFGHPNIQSHAIVTVFPISIEFGFNSLRNRQYVVAALSGLMSIGFVYADILTGSIAGIAGMLLCVSIILVANWVRLKHVYRLALVYGSLILLTIIFTIFSVTSVDGDLFEYDTNPNIIRVTSITGPDRLSVDAEALSLILQNPVYGYGMDQGEETNVANGYTITSSGVHNTLINSWMAGGFLTFIGVVLIYAVTVTTAIKAVLAYIKHKASCWELALATSVIAWAMVDMFQPSLYQRFTWITIALLCGVLMREYSIRGSGQPSPRY